MESSELMRSSFAELLQRAAEAAECSLNSSVKDGIGSPKGEGSIFPEAHFAIVDMSKESLPETISRHFEGLSEIVEDFFVGECGFHAAMEAARAEDHLKEATMLSCCADPNIRRALQVGLWAAELATKAKNRHAETAYLIGANMQENARRGANATRKPKPTKKQFSAAITAARQASSKEVIVDRKVAEFFGVGVSKMREWKAEFNLSKRKAKSK